MEIFSNFRKIKKRDMPNLFIIAGCNGAGKTTASFTILPDIFHLDIFVNADEIARGLSPLNPDKSAIEAGRLMLSKIDQHITNREDFAFETTLLCIQLKRLKRQGTMYR